ncbi:hypothetical protein HN748_06355 [Candidatus Peregrinibacteria bacterium]|jgi:hypothetical protein|nr:hypothetical protein [Candidatus Peregrinibacteria bacterium]MBT7484517.1 hypothetical protein [Candidatus Peregrinibacteria bacterium]MBT7703825.1 hypothetical protein [Candidatus Peregrinibacteria bacterium]
MLKTFKSLGAALIIAMLVVPHFVLAANLTPNSITCFDDGADPGDGDPTTECGFSSGDAFPHVVGDTVDGDSDTGVHMQGPEYPIIITLDLGSSTANVSGVNIDQGPGSYGGNGNRMAATGGGETANNTVDYSTNGSSWTSFGDIPAYNDDAPTSYDYVANVIAASPVTARYLRITNSMNICSGCGWGLAEFTVTTTGGGSVPEMGVWALLVILPIMGYVVYKSVPMIRPTAV